MEGKRQKARTKYATKDTGQENRTLSRKQDNKRRFKVCITIKEIAIDMLIKMFLY